MEVDHTAVASLSRHRNRTWARGVANPEGDGGLAVIPPISFEFLASVVPFGSGAIRGVPQGCGNVAATAREAWTAWRLPTA